MDSVARKAAADAAASGANGAGGGAGEAAGRGAAGSVARDRVIAKRTRNTRTRSGSVLSADAIVKAAMNLVGEHGAAALSVRRLGTALGCDPSAIYRYFAGMDALMLAVADRLIGQALANHRPGTDWKENLRSLARGTYAAYLAHPRVAIAVAARVTGGENETRIIDLVLGELRAAGFEGEQAVRLYRSFGDFILAFSAVDADYLARPAQDRAADTRRWHDAYAAVDAKQYPSLAALGPIVVDHAEMSTFESCLTLLLDTFERLAQDRG
ncbi:MAG TPA: TetR/AcrR family transcriptional regulator [Actinospica sp.]|nr:TetR/AcrR family transcriptional regulator [Actinospica sp.]